MDPSDPKPQTPNPRPWTLKPKPCRCRRGHAPRGRLSAHHLLSSEMLHLRVQFCKRLFRPRPIRLLHPLRTPLRGRSVPGGARSAVLRPCRAPSHARHDPRRCVGAATAAVTRAPTILREDASSHLAPLQGLDRHRRGVNARRAPPPRARQRANGAAARAEIRIFGVHTVQDCC